MSRLFLDTTGKSSLGIGICDRCKRKFPIGELRPDRDSPGLLVCRDDNDELDRYKLPPRQPEDVTLRQIRLDTDIAVDEDLSTIWDVSYPEDSGGEEEGEEDTSPPEPGNAIIYINFTTGTYKLNGDDVSLATLLTRTDMPISSTGARFDWNNLDEQSTSLTEAAIAALPTTGGFSFLIEWIDIDTESTMFPVSMWKYNPNQQWITITTYPNRVDTVILNNAMSRTLTTAAPARSPTTIRRLAMTRTKDYASMYLNGGSIEYDDQTGNYQPVFSGITLAGIDSDTYAYMDGYIRRFYVYPTMTDTELQALSSL